MKNAVQWTLALLFIFAFLFFISPPSKAESLNWNGEPEETEETEEAEETDDTVETVDPVDPLTPVTQYPVLTSDSDRDDEVLPVSRPLPCCIRDGKLVAKPTLFMRAKRALEICEKAKLTGAALIYECETTRAVK